MIINPNVRLMAFNRKQLKKSSSYAISASARSRAEARVGKQALQVTGFSNQYRFVPLVVNPIVKPKNLLSNQLKITNDQKKRNAYFKGEIQGQLQKSLQAYVNSTTKHIILDYRLIRRMRRTTITRIRNRCVLTAKSQTLGHLGLSRITFRRLANLGQIPGLTKV
jgi:ribosomal protein S14